MKNLGNAILQRMRFKNMSSELQQNIMLLQHTDFCACYIAQINKVQFFKLGFMLHLLFGGSASIKDTSISKTATYMNILIAEVIALRIDFHSNREVCIAQALHSFINI
jgi:hypothetical protein